MHAVTAIRSHHVSRLVLVASILGGLLYLGAGSSAGATTTQFCNTAVVTGPYYAGPADVYPSPITVSGISGTVSDVNVTLKGLKTFGDNNPTPEHWIEDADIMVSAPNGANSVLMSDAGGNNDVTSGPVNGDFTFDQQAATQLPADSHIDPGTYRPVNDNNDIGSQFPSNDDNWVAPAPAASGIADLNTFNGLSPNGTWNLWAVDDQNQGTYTLTGGWCIQITTGPITTSSTTASSSTTTGPTTTSSTTTTTVGNGNPTLSVGDVTIAEGDAKTRTANFPVVMSKASTQTVTVHYATHDSTAVAPGDYAAKSGTLTLAAGKVSGTIAVPIKGDTVTEADESFTVALSAPTNASVLNGVGIGVIVNDDPGSGLRLTVDDVTTYENNASTQKVTFTVALSAPATTTVTVQYATADGTAVAPGDYLAKSGTLTFNPGVVNQKVVVTVKSDNIPEPNETFNVNLSNPTGGATIADAQGIGRIRNDD